MGISKTEINLRRLLSSAPQQQNQAKLVHVSTTLFLFLWFECWGVFFFIFKKYNSLVYTAVNLNVFFSFEVYCYFKRAIGTIGWRENGWWITKVGMILEFVSLFMKFSGFCKVWVFFFFDRVSKAVLNDYSEKIEAIASKLVNSLVSKMCWFVSVDC